MSSFLVSVWWNIRKGKPRKKSPGTAHMTAQTEKKHIWTPKRLTNRSKRMGLAQSKANSLRYRQNLVIISTVPFAHVGVLKSSSLNGRDMIFEIQRKAWRRSLSGLRKAFSCPNAEMISHRKYSEIPMLMRIPSHITPSIMYLMLMLWTPSKKVGGPTDLVPS